MSLRNPVHLVRGRTHLAWLPRRRRRAVIIEAPLPESAPRASWRYVQAVRRAAS